MRREMIQQVLQIVYDHFYATGGTWPSLGYLQRTLNRQNDRRIDASQIVRRIPPTLLKQLSSAYPAPTELLILTLEGIKRCSGSLDDVENSLTAVNWMARWAERPGLSDENDKRGMHFTISQLAEGVWSSV